MTMRVTDLVERIDALSPATREGEAMTMRGKCQLAAIQGEELETTRAALSAAQEERDAWRDKCGREQARAESAEEEITRLTAERDNYKQVATDHLNQPVNLRDYQNVTKAVVYEHKRAESAEATLRQVQEIVEKYRGAHDRGLMATSNYAMNELEALLRASAGETA